MYKQKVLPDGSTFLVIDHSSSPRWFRSFERWWQKWGKAFLVAMLFVVGIAVWDAVKPPTYTLQEMRDYSVLYLNQVR